MMGLGRCQSLDMLVEKKTCSELDLSVMKREQQGLLTLFLCSMFHLARVRTYDQENSDNETDN